MVFEPEVWLCILSAEVGVVEWVLVCVDWLFIVLIVVETWFPVFMF